MALVVKNPPANAGDPGDMGSIPGSGRSPGGRHSNSLQYSCLENPMDSGAWQAIVHRIATSHTQLKQLHIRAYKHIYPPSHTWSSRPYCLFHCCYSVTKSCPTLCNPTDHSPADFPVLHYLPVCSDSYPLSWWCYPTISSSVTPLLFLPSIFPSIMDFSSDLAFRIIWPKYWSFSFNISPSNKYSQLISFRIKCFDFPGVQGTLKSLLQHHNLKASILQCSAFFGVRGVQLSHLYMITGQTIALIIQIFVGKMMTLHFKMLPRFVTAFLPNSKCLLIL